MTKQKKERAKKPLQHTWRQIVRDALLSIGKPAPLRELYNFIACHDRTVANPTWEATVRRTLQQSPEFERVAPGVWRLKPDRKTAG